MPKFSDRSLARLASCHPDLQHVFHSVIVEMDCTILTGHRHQRDQNKAFDEGRTKLVWPRSKHNQHPSLAVDAAPWPLDWNDRERFILFAGFVCGVARQLNVSLRWGGDWDGDHDLRDNRFDDLVHFELKGTS